MLLNHALPHTTDTYWNQFDSISSSNLHLNYFERLWAAWYAYIGNDVLATGIMSFMMHEIVYFGRSLPWIIIDMIPYFNKYKIQNVRICRSKEDMEWDTDKITAKSPDREGAVGVREAGSHQPLHCRAASDMVSHLFSSLRTCIAC